MKQIKNKPSGHRNIAIGYLRLTLLAWPVALLTGTLVAGFLAALDRVTDFRFAHSWLLYLLPVTGLLIWLFYRYAGRDAEAGNNLILEEIHEAGTGVPARMGPLILLTTLLTHLTGGSAGREGTAVQIGASIAGMLAKRLLLPAADVKMILLMGIAAGFGAVFGTPLAGAVFALEVVYIGRMYYKALLPCLVAALLADIVCTGWGIRHTQYAISVGKLFPEHISLIHFNAGLLGKVLVAGACFGLASRLFSEATHFVKAFSNRRIRIKWLIPAVGGLIITGMAMLPGGKDYLGLGVSNPDPAAVTIISAFRPGGAHPFSWLWKIIFTAITLGMGFKGGEVTPLFFVGATLGYTLGTLMGVPVDLMAGIGFLAVFAGAANTPVACVFMGMELFGPYYVLYFAAACFMAYYCSGHSGIYQSQRLNRHKLGLRDYPGGSSLKELRKERQDRLSK